ncbi:MAG: AEC family transporter [Pseudomonadota bacterium]
MIPTALIDVVLPVFTFIAIGYALVKVGLLPGKIGDALGDFVFTVAIPALLFRSVATLSWPDVSPWPFWGAYFSAIAVVLVAGMVITQKLFGRERRAGVIGGMSTAYANLVVIGIALVRQAYGEAALTTLFMLIAIHLPVMMTVSAILIEFAEARDRKADGSDSNNGGLPKALRRVLISLVKNPLIIAVILGSIVQLSGVTIDGFPRTILDRIAEPATTLALISLGMALTQYGVSGNIQPAIALGIVKLLVFPALVYVMAAWVFGLPPLAVSVLVLGAACPTGVNAYLIANRFQTGKALSANAITLTTAVSLLTITMWLAILPVEPL